MAKTSSVIEINGNRYDAVTGQMIGTVKRVAYQVKKSPSGVIDGFTKGVGTIAPKITQKQPSYKHKLARKNPSGPAQKVHHRTQKSSTLMRGLVARPDVETKNGHSGAHQGKNIEANQLDYARVSRASAFKKSSKVRRFGALGTQNLPASLKTKALAPVKASHSNTRPSSPVRTHAQSPGSLANLSSQQLERLLDHALLKADAHKKVFKGPSRPGLFGKLGMMPKWASMGACLLVVMLVAGFFAWQNIPQVSMQVAATRADIPASVPNYTPSGFSFEGPIGYSGGEVSMNFKANTDSQRSFTLTQQKSDWTTETLAANTVPTDTQVQTSQVKGTTVYIYGDQESRATWVDKGVRYTLVDKANLNSDQILKIAGSL